MNTNMVGLRQFSKIVASLCLDENSLSFGMVNPFIPGVTTVYRINFVHIKKCALQAGVQFIFLHMGINDKLAREGVVQL